MKKTILNIIVFLFANLLFFGNSLAIFPQPTFENPQSFQLLLKKETPPSNKAFFLDTFGEKVEEEKKQDDFPDNEIRIFHVQNSIQRTSLIQVIYTQVGLTFLKIKVQLFQHLFLLFHSLKIACC